MVINGDLTQVDLPPGRTPGLREAEQVLAGVEGIRFIYFNERDVVRHPLVQEVIRAYETRGGEFHTASPKEDPSLKRR